MVIDRSRHRSMIRSFGAFKASAAIEVACSQLAAWDLVANIERTGEFSPECIDARWLDDSSEPEVGARFEGTNRMVMTYQGEELDYTWIRPCTVTAVTRPTTIRVHRWRPVRRDSGILLGFRDRCHGQRLSDHAALSAPPPRVERDASHGRRRSGSSGGDHPRPDGGTHPQRARDTSADEDGARIGRRVRRRARSSTLAEALVVGQSALRRGVALELPIEVSAQLVRDIGPVGTNCVQAQVTDRAAEEIGVPPADDEPGTLELVALRGPGRCRPPRATSTSKRSRGTTPPLLHR